ncbi:S-layer homology domain-containing protein [Paenibacillus sp. RC67]|uniref:S-layer homology domain-containing protein n=1 Tax=Paenibacillus sp. RC67 TaxID=3039392 RepID=UPI0024ADDBC7|nr:S-layer homology domain-containing protein [Paenibacillus sp. RC67]
MIGRFKLGVIALLIFSLLLPSGLLVQPNGVQAAVLENLAKGKETSASSTSNKDTNPTKYAVDGDANTSWNSNSKDLTPWFQVDFGSQTIFNEVKLNWKPYNVTELKIQYLNSESVWEDVYVKRSGMVNAVVTDTIDFKPVTSSSLRLQLSLSSKNFQLYELEVYNNPAAVPPSEHLSSITLTDSSNHVYQQDEIVPLIAGGTKSLVLKGKLDSGKDAVLSNTTNYFKSSDPSIATVDNNGKLKALKDGKTTITAEAIVGGVMQGISLKLEVYDPALQSNIVRNKAISASSGNATAAVDGTSAAWSPSSADVNDDHKSWLQVDTGDIYSFNRTVITFTNPEKLTGYTILASDDGTVWENVYMKTGVISANEAPIFPKTAAQFVKLQLNHQSEGSAVAEFELYGSLLDILKNINFFDSNQTYQLNDTIYLNKGDSTTIKLKGTLTRNNEPNDLSKATVTFQSKNSKIVSIDDKGKITAVSTGTVDEGVILVTASASLNEKTIYTSIWVDVTNPNKDMKPLIADLQLAHPTMTMDIGQPALLNIGDEYPTISVDPYVNSMISADLIRIGTMNPINRVSASAFQTGVKQSISFPGSVTQYGQYQIRLTIETATGGTVYDTFYFTVIDPSSLQTDQSSIVYLGSDGQLIYVPDYKGNRVLDFSNVGYKGGGVKLPDVPAKVVVSPIEGDATKLIQDAIDKVSGMEEVDGIRGAVFIKKGFYDIQGQLYIRTSGVVLRGEGQDEKNGTVLFGSGVREPDKDPTIITVGNGGGMKANESTATTIKDMFVPAGSRSFHVEDASGFEVGNKVIVRRVGNQNWIHETGMDKIYDRPDRPDAVPGTTSQMSPFDMNFDREIIKIEGNVITVDAPIANSIELRWGGGKILKYDDPDRIQNVGVEKIFFDSAFDPSVISTVMDNDTTDPYFADDNHIENAIVLDGLKNGWVRNVTGKHLAISLVKINGNSKLITVQDSKVTDFVSTITGGTRYAYYFIGQLNLVQRSYSESERHAFVFDSRIPGPNVIHGSESQKNYNSSEPHHRWSTGGLFDQVKGHIVIRDRAWLGSGHTWAGANYVTWNTEGILTSQQPPTAQNYAIGHVGTKGAPLVPNEYDSRPRKDAYWDHFGSHVNPPSLYLQQLRDRYDSSDGEVNGEKAVDNIKNNPFGINDPVTINAPTGLTVTAGDSQTSLTWDTVVGATYYTVKRSTTPGGPYETIATNITDTKYTEKGLTNGTIYYYVVTASNIAGESAKSNEVSAKPSGSTIVVKPPAAPTAFKAVAGDAQASLTWDTVVGATYYTVKRSTTPGGPYEAVATIITDTKYTEKGLTNGTTYYYIVTATNIAGESASSNEVSAKPSGGTVVQPPAAPTALKAEVRYMQVALSWDTVTGATYYTLKRSLTSGGAYSTVASNLTTNSYLDNSLTTGPTYYYVVTASNATGESASSNEASARPYTPSSNRSSSGSSGGTSPGTPTVQPNKDGSQVISVDPVIEKGTDGRTIAKITLDAAAMTKAIDALNGTSSSRITIEAKGSDAAAASFQLPAQPLSDALAKTPSLTVSVKYGDTTYDLPIKAIDFEGLAKSLGVSLKDLKITITMEKVNDATLAKLKDKAKEQGLTLLSGGVDYKVTAEANGKSVAINDFGLIYVSRTMSIGKAVDVKKTSAVLFNPSTGEMSFVPATFSTLNGSTQATIKRPGNSVYAIVESTQTFADLKGHWAKDDVELLASKLVIKGMTDTGFAPDNRITRAEFAAILVRSLGLSESTGSKFNDVKANDWYAGVVGAASKAGLVDGYEDGTFKPEANITREQMAVMVARAMTVAGKKVPADSKGLASYTDSNAISGWAKDAVAQAVNAGIINGMTEHTFVPGQNASRAEAAVMMKRLLQYAEFMN